MNFKVSLNFFIHVGLIFLSKPLTINVLLDYNINIIVQINFL